MRVLWSSNAPWSATGYGQQTKFICRGIRDLGHDVAIHAWWGLQGGCTTWEGMPVYPGQLDTYGNDAAGHLCRKHRADVLITLIDSWVLDPNLGSLGSTKWGMYFPIDHADPIPPVIAQRFDAAHTLITYSQWAHRLVQEYAEGKYKSKARYIPHGVDCQTLRPAATEERAAIRRKLYPDWPEDAFVVGMVAANKGWPSRKSFPEALEAFARLAQSHPNARLYLHSFPGREFNGPPLEEMLQFYHIAHLTRLPNRFMLLGGEYSDEMMRDIFCSFDVLLAPSQGEGFGLPILEAQSCGVSVIVTDHSAMSELVGCGWRVRPLRLQPSLIWGQFAEADALGVHHALEECYRRPASEHWGAMAREFALQYDWPKIIPLWGQYLDDIDAGRRQYALELAELKKREVPDAVVAIPPAAALVSQ